MKKIIISLTLILIYVLLDAESIGLALSGGGARALAHIGVIKVIDEQQIPIDYIAGTSVGAVVGGLYALGYSGSEIEKLILDLEWDKILDDSILRSDVYISQKRWLPNSNIYFDLNDKFSPKLPQAFVPGNNLINELFDLTYNASDIFCFDDLKIPFRCVSTNILTGEKRVFSEGSLHEVMRASMSFPSVISPFQLDNELYIDGGIVCNLPSKIVKNMGADFIIGIDFSSGLKKDEQLVSLIDVLQQTISINMSENIEESREICDLLISADLAEINLLDFDKKKEIILAGENLARNYFANNPFEFTSKKKEKSLPQIPQKLFISSIKVEGNNHLSKSKIKEYISLQAKEKYSKKQIITAIKKTYNSQLFAVIYPVLTNSKDGYILTIKVKEKERKRLGINLVYNSNSEIMMGLTLDLNNIIQRNSKLLANLQIGNKNSFKLDYVKNFGKHYGVYFRLFPNITEEKLYEYDLETHQKISREKSLEIGNTLGIGLFATEAIILEAYGYGFKKRIYREENSEYHSAGIGLKCYHESLDDFAFPMKGAQFLLKYSSAKKGVFSEDGNRKFFSKIKILFPFGENISLKYQFEYGSYFEEFKGFLNTLKTKSFEDRTYSSSFAETCFEEAREKNKLEKGTK